MLEMRPTVDEQRELVQQRSFLSEAAKGWGLVKPTSLSVHNFYSIPYGVITLPSPELFGDHVNCHELNIAERY